MQYYTDLKWIRMVNLALRKEKKDLESIFDILKVKDAGRKPKKILVEGTYIQKEVIKTLTRNCLQENSVLCRLQHNIFLILQPNLEWARPVLWRCWR